jgi:hypothetical protein
MPIASEAARWSNSGTATNTDEARKAQGAKTSQELRCQAAAED